MWAQTTRSQAAELELAEGDIVFVRKDAVRKLRVGSVGRGLRVADIAPRLKKQSWVSRPSAAGLHEGLAPSRCALNTGCPMSGC